MNKIGYNQTDKKILVNIYDLEFEIKNLDNNKVEEIKENKENDNLEETIEEILGKGAVEKINNKRIQDGYEKMDLNVQTTILGFILNTYVEFITNNVFENVTDTFNRVNNRIYGNRNQRRNRYRR